MKDNWGVKRTEFLKQWSGSGLLKHFYLDTSDRTAYLLEVSFGTETRPSISIDFFPDNDTKECIYLDPDYGGGLSCSDSWSKVYYEAEVLPIIRARFLSFARALRETKEVVSLAHEAINLADSYQDVTTMAMLRSSFTDPRGVVNKQAVVNTSAALFAKHTNNLVLAAVVDKEDENLNFIVSELVSHGTTFAQVGAAGGPQTAAGANALKQALVTDARKIGASISGILLVDDIQERANETIITREMFYDVFVTHSGNFEQAFLARGLGGTPLMSEYAEKNGPKVGCPQPTLFK